MRGGALFVTGMTRRHDHIITRSPRSLGVETILPYALKASSPIEEGCVLLFRRPSRYQERNLEVTKFSKNAYGKLGA